LTRSDSATGFVRQVAWADPIPALLAATDPSDVLRNDLYDRDEARE
jgi:hypothetical protein